MSSTATLEQHPQARVRGADVAGIVERYAGLIVDPHVFFRPAIPPDKLHTALENWAAGASPEDVIVLVDDTLRTSGNGGVLLTDTRLYGKMSMLSPVSIPLTAIESVSYREARFTRGDLIVNGTKFMNFGCVEKEHLRQFARMLEEIVALDQPAAAPEVSAETVREAAAALKDLKELFDAGILTEEEFRAKAAPFLSQL